MRSQKAMRNFIVSIILQIVTAISGLVIPRLFISFYGSEVNGLVSSLNQFLSYITFLEAGLSGVIMSQLYKPIAEKNEKEINKNLANARNFFCKIAVIYIVYVVALGIIYPKVVSNSFTSRYIFLLTIILSINLLFQYLFGIVNNVLLQADQKNYIVYILQIIVVVLNAIIVIWGIQNEFGIHLLKLLTVSVATIAPLGLYFYVRKNYNINTKMRGNSKYIKQRWDGIFHHISYFIQNNVDVMILTFIDLKLVSVYAVYNMITSTIRKLFESFIISFRSPLGDMIARKEINNVKRTFSLLEFLIVAIISIVFVSLMFSILPFIKLYTKGINDINYLIPSFAILIILAEMFYIIRIPYHTIIIAAGHFKETRNSALLEAMLNLIISAIMVVKFGIIGVALGTCISCLYRTIYYILYLRKNILQLSLKKVFERIVINFFSIILCTIIFKNMHLIAPNYLTWFINGLIYVLISSLIILSINFIVFKEDRMVFINKFKQIAKY